MNYSKLNIILVGPFPSGPVSVIGGQLTVARELLDSSFSNEFSLLTIDSTQKSNPPPPLVLRSIFAFIRIIKLLSVLIYKKTDAIMIFFSSGGSVLEKGLMIKICNLFGISVIVLPRAEKFVDDYHTSRFWRTMITYFFANVDLMICQGKKIQQFARKDLRLTERKTPIIPNWTATHDILKIGETRDYTATKKRTRILFLAWVEQTKGIFELITACEKLTARNLNFSLTIAGDGHALKNAMDIVKEKKLSDIISFSGWVRGDQKLNTLKEHDIFVLPSWSEGFPNSVVESLASGLAVCVTDVGTISDFLENGSQAMIVKKKSIDELCQALECLITDDELRGRIGSNGWLVAKNNFSKNESIQKLIMSMHDILN